MRKVLYVSNRTGYSGAEVVLLRLIQHNKEVEPVVLAPKGLLTERLQRSGVKVYFSKNIFQLNRKQNKLWRAQIVKNLIFGFLEFAWVMFKERPDVVHANGLGASIYSSIPAWIFRKPFVWTDHDVFEPGSIESNWTKKLSGFSSRIITVSHYVEKSLLRIGIAQKKISTVYNGLDYTRFDPDKEKPGFLKGRLKIEKDKKIIAVFAMITSWKGHHIVIDAVKELLKNGRSDFILVFVGETDDEEYRERLDLEIKKLRLGKTVKFSGFLENTIAAYKDVDILINASVKPEPLGTTIYEAMAMKKLVIVSSIGGNTEIVTDNKTGFLVEPSSPKALMAKIEFVLDNFEELQVVAEEARKEVKKRFDMNAMIVNYNKIYDEVKN